MCESDLMKKLPISSFANSRWTWFKADHLRWITRTIYWRGRERGGRGRERKERERGEREGRGERESKGRENGESGESEQRVNRDRRERWERDEREMRERWERDERERRQGREREGERERREGWERVRNGVRKYITQRFWMWGEKMNTMYSVDNTKNSFFLQFRGLPLTMISCFIHYTTSFHAHSFAQGILLWMETLPRR
jgi:hypothetical protein